MSSEFTEMSLELLKTLHWIHWSLLGSSEQLQDQVKRSWIRLIALTEDLLVQSQWTRVSESSDNSSVDSMERDYPQSQ